MAAVSPEKVPLTTGEESIAEIFTRAGCPVCHVIPGIPGANGQGRTKEEARTSLAAAIALNLQDRREDGLRGVPDDAERETVTVR